MVQLAEHGWGLCFNPRPRTEGDSYGYTITGIGGLFQSTPPHGGRRTGTLAEMIEVGFNPRPRTEGD